MSDKKREEAALEYYDKSNLDDQPCPEYNAFLAGAEWEAKRYERVIALLKEYAEFHTMTAPDGTSWPIGLAARKVLEELNESTTQVKGD